MQFNRLQDLEIQGKTVLIREDLNVPIKDGKITNDARLKASLPTIQMALDKGAAVIVCSHLGRPDPANPESKYSLQPVADYLSQALKQEVVFVTDYLDTPVKAQVGQVILLENVRFNAGEKKNDDALSQAYADLCDVFVMDAFGTAHRAESSTEGVITKAKQACAGPLLAAELDALSQALDSPAKPMLAIVGGSKVSTKLDVLTSLAKICDQIIVGGGIANTFLAAKGVNIGASLYEKDMLDTAKQIMQQTEILLPESVVVAKQSQVDFEHFLESLETAEATTKSVNDIADDDMILDISADSATQLSQAILNAKTILWNGPVGVFEVDKFGKGTQIISEAVAQSEGFSIAGGGDTLAAIDKYKVADSVSYTSTGGGAFLEFVEGKTLPAVAALTKIAQ